MTDTDKSELEERIKQADTISALDKLRMNIVQSKDSRLLKMWQEKFWERKKKYSYQEVQALCNQARMDENVATAVALTSIIPDTFTYSKFLEYATYRKNMLKSSDE